MLGHVMTTPSKPSRTLVRQLEQRVKTLRAEESDAYTVSLGRAAVACVRESREAAEAELARVLRGAA
jgi:hypothetical protein